MKNYLKIEGDVFFIDKRLKEIDKSYFILFNLQKGVYEIHSNDQPKSSYCFTCPYPVLDERTIDFALKTRAQNRDKIIEEIERDNQLAYNKAIKNQVNLLKEALC